MENQNITANLAFTDAGTLSSELTLESIENLTEEQVSELISTIETEPDKEKRASLMKMVDVFFEVRSVASKNRNLKEDLAFFGYKFYPLPQNKLYQRGVRRKTSKRN